MATTEELLSHLGGHLLRDRKTSVTGGVNEPLWPDSVLIRYLNKAETLFARRTFCLIDATTAAVTQISVVANTTQYALHPSVLKVLSARLDGMITELIHVSHSEMHPGNTYRAYPWPDLTTFPPGMPRLYSTQESTGLIEFGPVPDGSYTAHLRVARTPITAMSLDALTATPEIPEMYHFDICDYAAYLALTEPEVDGYAPEHAATFLNRFNDNVRMARQDAIRLRSAPVRFFFGGW